MDPTSCSRAVRRRGRIGRVGIDVAQRFAVVAGALACALAGLILTDGWEVRPHEIARMVFLTLVHFFLGWGVLPLYRRSRGAAWILSIAWLGAGIQEWIRSSDPTAGFLWYWPWLAASLLLLACLARRSQVQPPPRRG